MIKQIGIIISAQTHSHQNYQVYLKGPIGKKLMNVKGCLSIIWIKGRDILIYIWKKIFVALRYRQTAFTNWV